MKKYIALLLVATILLTLTGCASHKVTTDSERHALAFTPRGGLSNLYIYTDDYSEIDVHIDDVLVGAVGSADNFIFLELAPGIHDIHPIIDKPFKALMQSFLKLDTQANKNYILRIVRRGLFSSQETVLLSDSVGKKEITSRWMSVAPANALAELKRKNNLAIIPSNLPAASKLNSPTPIAGNGGRFMSPFTSTGVLAVWAQERKVETDNGSDLAANLGGAIGAEVGRKALEFVPFGLGGLIGQEAGQKAGRAATLKKNQPQLPSIDEVVASSDISFNTSEELAVYMYAKHSTHKEYGRVLIIAQRIYPELTNVYVSAIEKTAQNPIALAIASPAESKKGASPQERLKALQKLKEDGLISDAEFQAKRSKIIDEM